MNVHFVHSVIKRSNDVYVFKVNPGKENAKKKVAEGILPKLPNPTHLGVPSCKAANTTTDVTAALKLQNLRLTLIVSPEFIDHCCSLSNNSYSLDQ